MKMPKTYEEIMESDEDFVVDELMNLGFAKLYALYDTGNPKPRLSWWELPNGAQIYLRMFENVAKKEGVSRSEWIKIMGPFRTQFWQYPFGGFWFSVTILSCQFALDYDPGRYYG
jgi:hypothetical protein